MTKQRLSPPDLDEASLLAARAGNDMMMTTTAFYDSAIRLVESGRLAESVLDGAVRNILRVKVAWDLFERPLDRAEKSLLGAVAHRESALLAARESVTLLKNDGMLPLDKSIKRIAVIGANADDIRAQYGDWTYFTHPHPNPKSHTRAPRMSRCSKAYARWLRSAGSMSSSRAAAGRCRMRRTIWTQRFSRRGTRT